MTFNVFEPKPIKRPREQVEGQLREAILGGAFQQGDRLPSELELSNRFGVSRTTIREALRSLANDGLLRKTPGAAGGSFVTAIDHVALGDQIRSSVETILRLGSLTIPEILQVRKILEVPAARMAATNRNNEQLGVFRACVDDVKHLPLGDPHIDELDVRFHSVIAEASGNRLLSAFVKALHDVLHPVQYLAFSEDSGRHTVLQHIAIVHALEGRDADGAASGMQEHLDYLETLPSLPRPVLATSDAPADRVSN
jgi:DNA-binding FadR family transcriptional regulator